MVFLKKSLFKLKNLLPKLLSSGNGALGGGPGGEFPPFSMHTGVASQCWGPPPSGHALFCSCFKVRVRVRVRARARVRVRFLQK